MLFRYAKSIPAILRFDFSTLDPGEEEYVRTQERRLAENLAKVSTYLCITYLVIGLFLSPFLVPPAFVSIATWLHVFGLVVTSSIIFYQYKLEKTIAPLLLAGEILFSIVHGAYTFSVLSSSVSIDHAWHTGMANLLGTCLLILICPYHTKIWFYSSVFRIAFLAAVVTRFHNLREIYTFVISAGILFVFMKAILASLVFQYFLKEFRQLRTISQLERQKIDADLIIARKIQDSLEPPGSILIAGDYTVSYRQEKHWSVGGDWTSSRALADGTLVVVVVDAVGKGVQAALVVHAVQSLWADSLSEESFDPKKWMNRVNSCLFRLGKHEPHNVTMGVLTISDGTLTYWSAGHLPIFLIDSMGTVTAILARGDMLGIGQAINLKSQSCELPQNDHFTLMMGSDGVFPKGSMTRSSEVLGIHQAALSSFGDVGAPELLRTNGVEDDKTLICIKRKTPLNVAV